MFASVARFYDTPLAQEGYALRNERFAEVAALAAGLSRILSECVQFLRDTRQQRRKTAPRQNRRPHAEGTRDMVAESLSR